MIISTPTFSSSKSPYLHFLQRKPISISSSYPICLIAGPSRVGPCPAIRTGPEGGGVRSSDDSFGSELLRKPVVSAGEEDEVGKKGEETDGWVDWEDQILEDTVPLVGFVRMILHSGKYESGDRLSPEHERTILERLLPYHPECDKKIGSGVDYITVGYHPNFESSRCLFIVRKDGEMVDFSYWKCVKGLIRKNYPLYADSFILRHFRRRRRND